MISCKNSHSLKSLTCEKDSILATNKIKEMLNWYKDNYSIVNQGQMIKWAENGNCFIDTVYSKQYLLFLQNSNYLSDAYIEKMTNYILKHSKPSDIEEENYNCDGFDYDLILYTQDVSSIFDQIEHLKVLDYTNMDSTIKVSVNVDLNLTFYLRYINTDFQIDSIVYK
jgi:hypothetical protein